MTPGEVFKAKLKEHGLELAEETIKAVILAAFDTAEVVVKSTPEAWDDGIVAALQLGKPLLLSLVDKINPVDNA